MPKTQFIDPAKVRAKGQITFSPIPVNAYDRSVAQELAAGNFTKAILYAVEQTCETGQAIPVTRG